MNSIIKGTGYALAHTPSMIIHNGSTAVTEKIVNPDSEFLKGIPSHLRSYQDVVDYWPNQVYIGNATPVLTDMVSLVRLCLRQSSFF